MEPVSLITITLLITLIAAVLFLIAKINKPKEDDKSAVMLQNQLNSLAQMQNETKKELNDLLRTQNITLNEQLNKSNIGLVQQFQMTQKSMKDSSDTASKIIREVTEKLTKLDETNKQVVNVAEQLQGLENILKNPKQRGILGEYFLESVLKNVFPTGKNYQMQYKLGKDEKTGKDLIVDAVIFVNDRVIPIDAKFSLENYNKIVETKDENERVILEKQFKQDLINRIEETSKYIRPEKNTMDFALMFIPSEGIYYDILVNKAGSVKIDTEKLIEEAFKKKVLIVSPTNLLAYLQTILQGLRAMQIEESAVEIKENVIKLQKHLQSFEGQLAKMGKSLGTTVNAYNDSRIEYKKIDKDVLKITGGTIEITSEEIDKPLTLGE